MEELSKDNLILFDAFSKHFSRELKIWLFKPRDVCRIKSNIYDETF